MITAFLELDHRGAVVASLPAFLLGDFHESLRLFVLGTVFVGVPLAVALAAHPDLATAAFTIFSARISINVYVRGFNPFTTASGRTI